MFFCVFSAWNVELRIHLQGLVDSVGNGILLKAYGLGTLVNLNWFVHDEDVALVIPWLEEVYTQNPKP